MKRTTTRTIGRAAATLALLAIAVLASAEGAREDGEFSGDGITAIEVDAGTFAVTVLGTRSRTTSLQVRNQPRNFVVLHTISGDRLRIWVEREFSFLSVPHHGELVLTVPGDVLLRVESATGSVDVRNIRSDRMELETSTGAIDVEDVSTELVVRTNTGDVRVRECSGGFDVTSTTGDIELIDTTGDMLARSSTGAHRYSGVIGDLEARSTTGRILIDGIQGRLSISTSTGNQSGTRVLLTGDSSFEASTGSIEMDFEQGLEDLEFDLRSTTGSLEVGRDESQRELFLAGAGFRVVGRTSTGSQSYY